jgi:hypothetical protein
VRCGELSSVPLQFRPTSARYYLLANYSPTLLEEEVASVYGRQSLTSQLQVAQGWQRSATVARMTVRAVMLDSSSSFSSIGRPDRASAPALVVELDELLPKGSLVGVVVDETFDLSHGLNWSGTQANLPGGRKSSRDALPNTHEYHIDPFPPGCRGFIRPPGRPRR